MNTLRLVTGLAALGALAGCMEAPVAGARGAPLDIAAYEAAVHSIGCELVSEADYGAVEFQSGMTREDVLTITQQRLAREQAVRLETGGVRLITGACAA
ncbi:MAG: hypothetical protein EP318_05175 [Rhodobacteraceae bacterium]|nr:MAG: hypothetical protein EP318_05175 [Paracoccaceae bacterium]